MCLTFIKKALKLPNLGKLGINFQNEKETGSNNLFEPVVFRLIGERFT